MKKVLSMVLVLSMLVMPVKMSSCFADEGQNAVAEEIRQIDFKSDAKQVEDLGTMVAIVDLDKYGKYTVKVDFYEKGLQFLKTHTMSEDELLYKEIGRYIREHYIREIMLDYGCSKVQIRLVMEYYSDLSRLTTYFFTEKGEIVNRYIRFFRNLERDRFTTVKNHSNVWQKIVDIFWALA